MPLVSALLEQKGNKLHETPHGGKQECPLCHSLLTEPEYEHVTLEFEKATGAAAESPPNVKYRRTMRSLKNAQGTEILSVREQYERMDNSALIHAAVALDGLTTRLGRDIKSGAVGARTKYKRTASRVSQGARRFVSRVVQWLNTWVFFVFKGTEEGLSKVTG
jgi:hypothetical protein